LEYRQKLLEKKIWGNQRQRWKGKGGKEAIFAKNSPEDKSTGNTYSKRRGSNPASSRKEKGEGWDWEREGVTFSKMP